MGTLISFAKPQEYWALKNINLKIGKGERLGIVGPNGSGKTTLLKIIAGITTPTKGKVIVKGKTTSVVELGAGFHPELTGRENIELNALILGMSKEEIRLKTKSVIDFADIGNFINSPLYTYSSGMKLRLGFAIALSSEPNVLVLDENISVGDRNFKKKSANRIRELAKNGTTIVIATHSLTMLRRLCNKAIWLNKGRIASSGTTKKVIKDFWRLYDKV